MCVSCLSLFLAMSLLRTEKIGSIPLKQNVSHELSGNSLYAIGRLNT